MEIQWYARDENASSWKCDRTPGSKRFMAVNARMRVNGLEFEGGRRLSRSGFRLLMERSLELIKTCISYRNNRENRATMYTIK